MRVVAAHSVATSPTRSRRVAAQRRDLRLEGGQPVPSSVSSCARCSGSSDLSNRASFCMCAVNASSMVRLPVSVRTTTRPRPSEALTRRTTRPAASSRSSRLDTAPVVTIVWRAPSYALEPSTETVRASRRPDANGLRIQGRRATQRERRVLTWQHRTPKIKSNVANLLPVKRSTLHRRMSQAWSGRVGL